jgi:hypothetical protein
VAEEPVAEVLQPTSTTPEVAKPEEPAEKEVVPEMKQIEPPEATPRPTSEGKNTFTGNANSLWIKCVKGSIPQNIF